MNFTSGDFSILKELNNESYFETEELLTNVTSLGEQNRTCTFDIRTLDLSEYEYRYRKATWKPIGAEEIIKICLYILVILVSLVGNSLLILVVCFYQHMRTSTNQYLVNLAVADLLVTLCCTWVHLVRHLSYPNYVLPSELCKLEGFIIATTLTASVLTLTIISVGRFFAVLFPFQTHTSSNRACRIIVAIWVSSALLASPTLPFRQLYSVKWQDFTLWHCDEFWPIRGHFDPHRGRCIITFDAKKVFYSLFTLLLYFIPVSVMMICYSLVVWRLWANPSPGEQHHQYAHSCIMRSKKKVVKMVTVVLLVFVVCWTPLQTIIFYSNFIHSAHHHGELPELFEKFEYAAYFIAHANSAINPIIYYTFNNSFRESVKAVLHCKANARGRLHSRRFDWNGVTGRTRDTTFKMSAPTDPPLQMQSFKNQIGRISIISSRQDSMTFSPPPKDISKETMVLNNFGETP